LNAAWFLQPLVLALKDQSVGSEMKLSIISDFKVCRSCSLKQDTGEKSIVMFMKKLSI